MSDSRSSYREFIIKVLIASIIIAAGIFTGIFVSVKSGLTDKLVRRPIEPTDLSNRSALNIGDQFPYLELLDSKGQPADLPAMLTGKKTIVAFVTGGCGPCHDFLEQIRTLECVKENYCRVVLLTEGSEYLDAKFDYPAFSLQLETLRTLSIVAMPTVIGVDEHNVIRFVSSGFGSMLDNKFIEKYL